MKKSGIIIVLVIVIIIGIAVWMHAKKSDTLPADSMNPDMNMPGSAPTGTNPGTKPGTTPAPAAQSPNAATVPAVDGTVAIGIRNNAFSPAILTVKKGAKVTWQNHDQVSHTVTSDSGKALDSGNLAQDGTYSVTFSDVGTYAYHCDLHPNMKGKIIVIN
jgi:plastocyanin